MKILDTVIIYLTLALLILCSYLAFANTWIAADINNWQMTVLKQPKFYPILTIAIMFIPPMLVVLPLKLYLSKKLNQEKRKFK